MFKNRFLLIVGLLGVLLMTMAISRPFSSAPTSPVVPITGASEYLDYYQRYSERNAPAEIAVDMSDYFARHPALRRGLPTSAHTILNSSLIDECFDVSLSEVAACRASSQSPAP